MPLTIAVPKEKAESTRKLLLSQHALDFTRAPARDGRFVYFPVTKKIAGFRTASKKLQQNKPKPASLEEALQHKLPAKLLPLMPRAFDIIGDIAIIEIPSELKSKSKIIGKALILAHPHIKAVYAKAGKRKGKYRTRALKHIAGAKRTTTIHKESNCSFALDIAKAYFSPRLVHEREVIANLARPHERVLALFAGVGPFPVILAKAQPSCEIKAIELNPLAARYLKQNIELNNLSPQIEPIGGDVSKILPRRFKKWADRIIMSYPDAAYKFLPYAFAAAKPGCTVHFYCFAPEKTAFTDAEALVKAAASKARRKIRILSCRIVLPYAPHVVQTAIDFRIEN
ncbi:MAG: class I SAM-dependent methyltransferase family protein [Candidatus Micrarchaeia archaeon]|jgi:tRNA (guanine37-N1)-methyltransferase